MTAKDIISQVSIDTTLDPACITPTEAYGGMRMCVAGQRLNAFVNETAHDWAEWQPEYVGECLTTDMWTLLETTTAVLNDPVAYQERTVEFLELVFYIVVEPLDDETLRIAFRAGDALPPAERDLITVPQAACGYPVATTAWAKAVLQAGQELRDELVEYGHDELGNGFDPLLDNLRAALAAHEQTS